MAEQIRLRIVRQMAEDMLIPKDVIDKVVDHQFDSALEAVHKHNSIEFSGFGRFYFNKKKAAWWVDTYDKGIAIVKGKLDDPEVTERAATTLKIKLHDFIMGAEYLRKKMEQ